MTTERRMLWGQRGSWLLMLATVPLSLLLRLHRLGAESLWYDETVSAYLASLSPAAMLAHARLDIHPPGYYALLQAWSALAGTTEYSLALFSAVASVLTVAVVARLGREVGGARSGAIAGIVAASSAFAVWYAQEVRMYALAGLLLATLTLLTWRTISGRAGARQHFLWGAIAAAAMYTLYYSAFALVPLSLAWLLAGLRGHREEAQHWLMAHGLALAAYLPWLPSALRQVLNPPVPPWRSAMTLTRSLLESASALLLGEAAPAAWQPVALAAAVLLALVALARRHERSRHAWLLVVAFAGPWALLLTASALQPLFHPRYLYPYSAAFAAITGIVLASLWTRGNWARLVTAGLLILLLAGQAWAMQRMWTLPEYRPDDLRGAVAHLREQWVPEDVITTQAGYTYTALAYYWPETRSTRMRLADYAGESAEAPLVLTGGSLGAPATLGWGHPDSDFYATNLAQTTGALEAALQSNSRLWQVRLYDTVTDPQGELRQWLDQSLVMVGDETIAGPSFGRLQLYQPPSIGLTCDDPLELPEGGALCYSVAAAGRRAAAYLTYDGPDPAELHYSLRLRSFDSVQLTQRDGPLATALNAATIEPSPLLTAIALDLPAGAGSGAYDMALSLYRLSATGEISPLTVAPGSADGLLVLGTVVLE